MYNHFTASKTIIGHFFFCTFPLSEVTGECRLAIGLLCRVVHMGSSYNVEFRPRDTETGDPARLPAQVAGRWGLIKWKSVRLGKQCFVLGWLEQAKAWQKSLVPARRAKRSNQGRTPFICTPGGLFASVSTARATPLWCLCYDLNTLLPQHLSYTHKPSNHRLGLLPPVRRSVLFVPYPLPSHDRSRS